DIGEEIRYVFPNSPAATAGLKVGDRIMKVGAGQGPLRPFAGRDTFAALLDRLMPNIEVKLEVNRKDGKKVEVVKAVLGMPTDSLPEEISAPASRKRALDRKTSVPFVPLTPPEEQPKDPEEQPKKARPKGNAETREQIEPKENPKAQ